MRYSFVFFASLASAFIGNDVYDDGFQGIMARSEDLFDGLLDQDLLVRSEDLDDDFLNQDLLFRSLDMEDDFGLFARTLERTTSAPHLGGHQKAQPGQGKPLPLVPGQHIQQQQPQGHPPKPLPPLPQVPQQHQPKPLPPTPQLHQPAGDHGPPPSYEVSQQQARPPKMTFGQKMKDRFLAHAPCVGDACKFAAKTRLDNDKANISPHQEAFEIQRNANAAKKLHRNEDYYKLCAGKVDAFNNKFKEVQLANSIAQTVAMTAGAVHRRSLEILDEAVEDHFLVARELLRRDGCIP